MFKSGHAVGSDQWCADLSHFISDLIETDSYNELKDEDRRTHLGVSEIGHPCARKIWYGFRWVFEKDFDGRMRRLFKRGHDEEAKIVYRLQRIGINASDRDPTSGKQYRISNEFNRHFGGSLDSLLYIEWPDFPMPYMLGEYKTHNKKSFDRLVKNGLKGSKPQHYTQMCIYGKRFGQTHGLYIAVCKDDDAIKPIVVTLDWRQAEMYEAKADKIIRAEKAPPRISERPTHRECTLCDYVGQCHMGQPYQRNCRSCENALPTPDGEWRCKAANGVVLPKEYIPVGCAYWRPIT